MVGKKTEGNAIVKCYGGWQNIYIYIQICTHTYIYTYIHTLHTYLHRLHTTQITAYTHIYTDLEVKKIKRYIAWKW